MVSPCGTLSSKTMMVMMIAMTPSLKASSLALFILVELQSTPLPPDDDGNYSGQQEYHEENGQLFGKGITVFSLGSIMLPCSVNPQAQGEPPRTSSSRATC